MVTTDRRARSALATLRRAIAIALLATGLSAGVAFADQGPGISHLSATYFTAAYDNGADNGGAFKCAGEHIVVSAPKAATSDFEVCSMSNLLGWTPHTYQIVTTSSGNWQAFWWSDFNGNQAVSGTIVVVGHKDGTGTMFIAANF